MRLYFDDGPLVRNGARLADGLYSSAICIAEMACPAHRKVREGPVSPTDAVMRRDLFLEDVNSGVITAVPVTDRLLRRVETTTRALPLSSYLRTFDALHWVTAADHAVTWSQTNPARPNGRSQRQRQVARNPIFRRRQLRRFSGARERR